MVKGSQTLLGRANLWLPISMRYGQYRYYWLALFAGVTGHQMLFSFTLQWTMYDLTGEVLDITWLTMAIALPGISLTSTEESWPTAWIPSTWSQAPRLFRRLWWPCWPLWC